MGACGVSDLEAVATGTDDVGDTGCLALQMGDSNTVPQTESAEETPN